MRNCFEGYLTPDCASCPYWADGTEASVGCATPFPIMHGGGCASMATFFDDCNQYYSISDTILNLILDTLHCSEAATKDTLLIVEIR